MNFLFIQIHRRRVHSGAALAYRTTTLLWKAIQPAVQGPRCKDWLILVAGRLLGLSIYHIGALPADSAQANRETTAASVAACTMPLFLQ